MTFSAAAAVLSYPYLAAAKFDGPMVAMGEANTASQAKVCTKRNVLCNCASKSGC